MEAWPLLRHLSTLIAGQMFAWILAPALALAHCIPSPVARAPGGPRVGAGACTLPQVAWPLELPHPSPVALSPGPGVPQPFEQQPHVNICFGQTEIHCWRAHGSWRRRPRRSRGWTG